jgi:hypothetical protein
MSDTFFNKSGSSPGSPENKSTDSSDFLVENHFTLFLLFACSDSAKIWCDENLTADRMTFGHGIVIEARYFWSVLEGIQNDGLTAVSR